jgi:hypothetical protein
MEMNASRNAELELDRRGVAPRRGASKDGIPMRSMGTSGAAHHGRMPDRRFHHLEVSHRAGAAPIRQKKAGLLRPCPSILPTIVRDQVGISVPGTFRRTRRKGFPIEAISSTTMTAKRTIAMYTASRLQVALFVQEFRRRTPSSGVTKSSANRSRIAEIAPA